jgi:hypothetical protein
MLLALTGSIIATPIPRHGPLIVDSIKNGSLLPPSPPTTGLTHTTDSQTDVTAHRDLYPRFYWMFDDAKTYASKSKGKGKGGKRKRTSPPPPPPPPLPLPLAPRSTAAADPDRNPVTAAEAPVALKFPRGFDMGLGRKIGDMLNDYKYRCRRGFDMGLGRHVGDAFNDYKFRCR